MLEALDSIPRNTLKERGRKGGREGGREGKREEKEKREKERIKHINLILATRRPESNFCGSVRVR
jgi:hypothetical protein